jgi:hypothetical protein
MIRMFRSALLLGFALVASGIQFAVAADSCTDWMWQPDGSYWRTCVDSQGKQYCQVKKDGKISRVDCKS